MLKSCSLHLQMSTNSEALNELSEFLSPDGRLDLKSLALQTLLSLTASKEGRHLLLSSSGDDASSSILPRVARLAFEDEQDCIRFDSLLFLLNLTSDNELSILNNKHMSIDNEFWSQLLKVTNFRERDSTRTPFAFSAVSTIVSTNTRMPAANSCRM